MNRKRLTPTESPFFKILTFSYATFASVATLVALAAHTAQAQSTSRGDDPCLAPPSGNVGNLSIDVHQAPGDPKTGRLPSCVAQIGCSTSRRYYQFNNQGVLAITAEFGKGGAGSMGYRQLIFPPRRTEPGYLGQTADGDPEFRMANGRIIRFDHETCLIQSIEGVTLRESPIISAKVPVNLTIEKTDALIFDSGNFRHMAWATTAHQSDPFRVMSPNGKSCTVTRKTLYAVKPGVTLASKGNLPYFAPVLSDIEIQRNLKNQAECSGIDLSTLSILPKAGRKNTSDNAAGAAK